jgi:competence protein ComEA
MARFEDDPAILCPRQRLIVALLVAVCAGMLLAFSKPQVSTHGVAPAYNIEIDPNTAPAALLVTLPGVGPSRAQAIIAERERAPFASLIELERRVSGIGPATVAGFDPYVKIPRQAIAPTLEKPVDSRTIALTP